MTFKENVLNLEDLKEAAHTLIKSGAGGKLLSTVLPSLAYEYGPQFVRALWEDSKCEWSDFIQNVDPKEFIQKHVGSARFFRVSQPLDHPLFLHRTLISL